MTGRRSRLDYSSYLLLLFSIRVFYLSDCSPALLVKVWSIADRWHCNTFLDHCPVSVYRCHPALHMLLGEHINYSKFSEIIFEIIFR